MQTALTGWLRLARIPVVVMVCACSSSEDDTKANATAGEWRPYPADHLVAEKSLPEWTADAARWVYAQTSCESPNVDDSGKFCGDYQPEDGSMFFFAAGTARQFTMRTQCEVPAGRPLFIPLVWYITDNGGVPEEETLSEAELADDVDTVRATMTDFKLVVDGFEVGNLDRYSVETTRFSYTLPPEPNWYSCAGLPGVTGLIEPAFVAGYVVVMPPPPAGKHEIEYGGAQFATNPDTHEEEMFANHVKSRFVVR